MSKCVICEEVDIPQQDLLECGHSICSEDLSKLRNFSCPICRSHLSGKLLTEEISRQILLNQTLDEDRSMMADRMHTIRMMMDPDYLPEEHYDDDPVEFFRDEISDEEGEIYEELVLPPGLSIHELPIETLRELLS